VTNAQIDAQVWVLLGWMLVLLVVGLLGATVAWEVFGVHDHW
jgi:hypothetical protein